MTDQGSGGDEAPYSILRQRNFRLYLAGRFIASFGQQMVIVAVGFELYERTNSALNLGLVGLTSMLPMLLFTLPAGHLADNRNRKHILLWMTAAQLLGSVALALVSALSAPTALVYACLAVSATARTFLWPASSSFLPQLVPRHVFPRAVAWTTGSFQLSSVAGPAAGGALIALTKEPAVIYALNAVSGLACLLLVGMVRYQPARSAREPISVASLAAGFKFVFATRVIFGTITLDLFAVLLGGATALLPIFAKDILHSGPAGLGLLQAALPFGSLVSALYLAHRPPMEKAGRAMLWAVAIFGLATIAFGCSRWFWFSWVMLWVCGAADNVSVVVRHTLVQLLTPDEKRGRVSAVNSLFIGTSNELGGFESGVVAWWLGSVAAVVLGGAGTILVVLAVAWVWPEIRRYGRLDMPGP